MADVTARPAPVAGPIAAVVAGLLATHPQEPPLIVRLGWQASPNGTLRPISLVVVRCG
ncbi:hypothetical protein [Streptomyces sp. MMBL 11-1]|uniref:hypothetical protein n=1 Tax=Streptomyces sp. MMBL 11-1 TaxID=3026420 RepID=UPI00235E24C0|nr:hypothetical protein [Streptomyces sp. MMBL 11-1]